MDEDDGTPSDMDDSFSPDLGHEWMNWRVDYPELESDETAEEGVIKKKKKKHLRCDGRETGMSGEPAELADC